MPGNADRILTAQEQKFIRMYVKPEVRDLRRAAELIGLKGTMGKTMWNRPCVRADIERRLNLVTEIQAQQDAADAKLLEDAVIKADILANDVLDGALLEMVKLDAKEHGGTKLQALRMAYVVKGRVTTRDMASAAPKAAEAQGPNFYRAFEEVTVTRREVESSATPDAQPVPAKVIQASSSIRPHDDPEGKVFHY